MLSTSRAMAGILSPTSTPSQNPLADKITLRKAAVNKTDGAPCFSRHPTTTALRLAEGHAFTTDYARRFRLDIPDSSEEENHFLVVYLITSTTYYTTAHDTQQLGYQLEDTDSGTMSSSCITFTTS